MWLEDEDNLLKQQLSGMLVTDNSAPGGRPVKVWFRMPEPEERPVTWPFLTLELVDIAEAPDRAHQGARVIPTADGFGPVTIPAATGKSYATDYPAAMNLRYQVSAYARSSQHDRQITAQIWTKLPGKFANLPNGAGNRPITAQLLGFTTADRVDEFGKRTFRKIYDVTVFSELWATEIKQITQITGIKISVPVLFGNEANWFSELLCHE